MDTASDDFVQFVDTGFDSAAGSASLDEAITFAFENFNAAVTALKEYMESYIAKRKII